MGHNASDLPLQCISLWLNIVIQVAAWKLRPPLPHAVESTWLLTEACLADIPHTSSSDGGISVFSIKAGYLTALTRFVTAVLDASQTAKYKVSMYTKAAELGLPAMFVDLRHEATHGEMPSLEVLREAARKALDWIWEDYWSKLTEVGNSNEEVQRHEQMDDTEMQDGVLKEAANAEGGNSDVEPWAASQGPWFPRPIGLA